VVAAASDLGACVCEDDATVTELDDLQARVRVQAEQIAALQEALRVARLAIDRAMWPRVRAKVDAALALAEGCAAPARTSGPLCMDSRCAHPKGFHRKGHGSCLECACIAFKLAAPADEEEK